MTNLRDTVGGTRQGAVHCIGCNRDELCMLMQAAPRHPDSGPKTLQAFVDALWQLEFTSCGGFEFVCGAWADVIHIAGVAGPPRANGALVQGTCGMGMRMRTSSQNTWRRKVLESHLGLSLDTTSTRKKLHRLGHHHRLPEEIFRQHCAEQYRELCPIDGTIEVVGRNIVFIRGRGHGHWCAIDLS